MKFEKQLPEPLPVILSTVNYVCRGWIHISTQF